MGQANSYDAIVIGGGHNGLVAAAYLARSGARVVVCEARHKTGGAAATDQPWPDHPEFKVTTLSYVMSLMPNTIIRDLQLKRHGYRVHPVGPYVVPFADGRVMVEYGDNAKNHDRALSSRSGVVKINLGVSRLPKLASMPGWTDFSGGFEIAPSIEQLERSFEQARAGEPATFPFSDGVIPSAPRPVARAGRRARRVLVHAVGAAYLVEGTALR
jgi:phytoene dehydrogenase-like protein